jgi:hypothetical protein
VLHAAQSPTPQPLDAPGLLGAAGARYAGAVPGAGTVGVADGAAALGARAERADRAEVAPADAAPADRSELLNRAVNVLIAGVALLLLAPVCVVVALLVKLTSPGPVFYTQTRVGLDRRWRAPAAAADDDRRQEDLGGQPFTILKFRSMRVDAEAGGQAVWATKHDPRITPSAG